MFRVERRLEPREELLWEGTRVHGVMTSNSAKPAGSTTIASQTKEKVRVQQKDLGPTISLEGAQTPIPEPHVGCTLSEDQNREDLGVKKNADNFDPRDIGDSREQLSDIAIKITCSEGTEKPADSAIGCDAVKRNVLSKEARAQHRDAEVRQVAKETDKQVKFSATSGNVIPVGSGKISAVTSPKRKPPGEKEVGLRKKKLGSKVTRRNVVTRNVTRRDVGFRGLKAGIKREQLGTS